MSGRSMCRVVGVGMGTWWLAGVYVPPKAYFLAIILIDFFQRH